MLRQILLASAGAMALTGAALAADLPPPPPPPPPPLWTGFYAGLNAGGTWSGSNNVTTAAIPGPCASPALGCVLAPNYSVTSAAAATFIVPVRTTGFIGGGQIGYNLLFSSLVAGIEADIQGVAGASNTFFFTNSVQNPNFLGFPIVQGANVTKSLGWLGTVRGRLGFLITPTLLIYGDGGLAYGGVSASTSIAQTVLNAAGLTTGNAFGGISNTRAGWTAGGGVEWMFAPNWSIKAEYLYYDLGSVRYGLAPLAILGAPAGATFASSFAQSSARCNGHVVRAGLNYHFNWFAPAPVVATY